ncbi:phenylalanine 4-monooxygenase [Sandarakinorhabdus sp.]|uniref:phenylalanine 4-monooxygenase n=1 Tax=Sandarakinorhabdus sp. TaxID=1916663 RepID=UPI00333F965C
MISDLPAAAPSADYTIPQDWAHYTAADHGVWDALFDRQTRLLPGRVAPEFLEGLQRLDLTRPGIPDFARLNDELSTLTGWTVVAVPGLVPDAVFFDHLANRRFPAGNFIRRPDQLDYLQEPDVFHDVFGHVPLLAHPAFADYMQAYGRGGLRALNYDAIARLARLYWYTVEFGLMRVGDGLAIYGAGIVSSRSETLFALDSASPNRIGWSLERVLRTPYRIDDFQQNYFVIDSFDDLLRVTLETDFGPLYERLAGSADIPIAAVLPDDSMFTRGDQSHIAGAGLPA